MISTQLDEGSVDDEGRVVGVVSEADFVIKERGVGGVPHRLLARLFGESPGTRRELAKIEAQTAGQAMTSPAVTIAEDDSVHHAAEIMAGRKINRLPVVRDGVLVGIVTRADIVRAFVRSDEELERLVREDVLARTAFWLEPETFRLVVHDGGVHLEGRVERRSLADTIVEVIRDLGGVVGVELGLTWDQDDVAPPLSEPDPRSVFRPH